MHQMYCVEFQGRGPAHAHILVATVSAEHCAKYIGKYIAKRMLNVRSTMLQQIRRVGEGRAKPWRHTRVNGFDGYLHSMLGLEAFAQRRAISFLAWRHGGGHWGNWLDSTSP